MSETILSKNIIDKIISGDVNLKEFEQYKRKINERFCYIIEVISQIKDYKIYWFDYDNLAQDDEIDGFFDPIRYKENIYFVVEYKNKRNFDYKNDNFDLYENSFPINFLYSDFEELVSNQYKKFKDDVDSAILQEQQLNELTDKKYQNIIKQIKNKLTKEELSYINFIKPKK